MAELEIKYNKYPSVSALIDKIKPTIENNVKRLDLIQGAIVVPIVCDLQQLYDKFEQIFKGSDILLTDYEKRNLSFHFYEMEEDLVKYYLDTYLISNWNKLCIKGLMHAIVLYYNDKKIVGKLRNLLSNQLDDFTPVELLAYEYLIDNKGPSLLAEQLRRNKILVEKAPTYLLLQKSMFSYPYFEEVMKEFFRVYSKFTIDDDFGLKVALQAYNKVRFNKILLPKIIIRISKDFVGDNTKAYFIKLCKHLIGEPNDHSLWQDHTLDNSEKSALTQARHIIRCWMFEKAIERVFEGAKGDYHAERSKFWKRYAKRLLEHNKDAPITSFFRVYTSELEKLQYLKFLGWNNFYRLYQQAETVVIMRFGIYTIVEFLSGGCMYVYKHSPSNSACAYNFVWYKTAVYNTDDFKYTNTEMLHDDIYHGNYTPDNFKVAHRGDWTLVYRHLLTKLGIRP